MEIDINARILESGIKKTKIAQRIGISLPLLSQYINGGRSMPPHIKQRITDVLSWYEEKC